MSDDNPVRDLALAVVSRAFRDLRNPVRRHEAEQFFCCEGGRTWIALAGLEYDKIMLMVEKVGEMPAIDRRNRGKHRQHKKHIWRRHK
jgi:hypothetical protein